MEGKMAKVTQWEKDQPPREVELQEQLKAEGLSSYTWSNGPGDVYGIHSHPFHKVIYVVRGSIVFGLPEAGLRLELGPGDRLDLPARVVHDAVVGKQGVVCLEAHRPE